MTNESFQSWLAGLDRLTDAQWSQLTQAVQEHSEGAAAVAAIELRIDAERRCRHSQAGGAVRRGKTRGLRRYSCKQCGKTFNALSGTALSGLHHKQRWLALGRSLVERESVRESARRCRVAVTTAFRWRHRFMAQAGQLQGRLEGLVEADETYACIAARAKGSWRGRRAGGAGVRGSGACPSRCRCCWRRRAGARRRAKCWRE